METLAGEAVQAAVTTDPKQSSAASDLGALSKKAGHEMFVEISASAAQTRAASSAAWNWLRQGAERRLGIEVSIEDPALRELFGHLLQVESLLGQIRADAEGLTQGALLLAEGTATSSSSQLSSPAAAVAAAREMVGGGTGGGSAGGASSNPATALAEQFTVLAQCRSNDPANASRDPHGASKPYSNVLAMVADAHWQTVSLSPNAGNGGSARYRMERRVQAEVLDCLDARLAEHEHVRELLRERQVWRQKVENYQRQVASLRKEKRSGEASGESEGSGHSALHQLSLEPASGRLGIVEEKLQNSQSKVAQLDEEVLNQLLQIKKHARGIVGRPWAILAKIRVEFFAAMAGHWAPVASSLLDPRSGSKPAAVTATASDNRDSQGGASQVDTASSGADVRRLEIPRPFEPPARIESTTSSDENGALESQGSGQGCHADTPGLAAEVHRSAPIPVFAGAAKEAPLEVPLAEAAMSNPQQPIVPVEEVPLEAPHVDAEVNSPQQPDTTVVEEAVATANLLPDLTQEEESESKPESPSRREEEF